MQISMSFDASNAPQFSQRIVRASAWSVPHIWAFAFQKETLSSPGFSGP
jgi:hypothetical protein